jgi:hypothetical protein
MRSSLWILFLCLLAGCASVHYEPGMHREDIQERVQQLDLEVFVSELRIGNRHSVMLIPQAGFPRVFDSTSLANQRSSFGRFKPTDTPTSQANRWIEAMAKVELWHAIILRDSEMVELIDDEDRGRLIDRVGHWMQDYVDPNFSLESLDELRIDLNSAELSD